MQHVSKADSDVIAKYFRPDFSAYLAATGLRKSRLSVTRVRCDKSGHGLTNALPPEPAFSVLLQLRDAPKRELFLGGRSVYRGGYAARTTSIVDLAEEPTANLESPFDVMHFYVSREALNEIADEQGVRRVATLSCGRGIFDPTVWHLGQALLPAMERPHEIGAMYADQLLLATHTYFAVTFGGMRPPEFGRRGGLAPWQLRCATELMLERLGEDISLADVAGACGLSSNYFARAFKKSVGTPPYRWLLTQRVLRAKSLLRDEDLSLVEIAAGCGFADQSHFTRVFTTVAGASPGAWRKQTR